MSATLKMPMFARDEATHRPYFYFRSNLPDGHPSVEIRVHANADGEDFQRAMSVLQAFAEGTVLYQEHSLARTRKVLEGLTP